MPIVTVPSIADSSSLTTPAANALNISAVIFPFALSFNGTEICASFVFAVEVKPVTLPVMPIYAFNISLPFSSFHVDVPLVNLSFAIISPLSTLDKSNDTFKITVLTFSALSR